MNRDLTEGRPGKRLIVFALPMMLSIVFQQLYNMADSAVVGWVDGKAALAAVSESYAVTMLFIAIATGLNLGVSVVNSQLFGARHFREMKTAIRTSLIFSAALAFNLMIVGRIFSEPILRFLNTEGATMQDASAYLNIYIYGLGFLFLYNTCTGIFNAMGDSRTPLFFLVGSSVANIGLDFLFVAVLRLGVRGVALATFLCQGLCSAGAFLVLMLRLRKLKTERSRFFSWSMLGKILYVAVPSILQQSCISVGNLFIQELVNSFGLDVIAGYGASIKLNNFVITLFCALGNGMSAFTAQNMGAGKIDRVKKGVRAALIFGVALGAVLFAGLFFPARSMVGLFMDAENANNLGAIEVGIRLLHILTPYYPFIIFKIVLDGVLRGSGEMKAFMISTFSDLVLRVGMAFLLSALLASSDGIWYAWPIGWVAATVISIVFYAVGGWKHKDLHIA